MTDFQDTDGSQNTMKEIDPIAEMGYTVETECMTRERSYSRDKSRNYYKNDYRNDYRKENHRDFKDQRYKRKHKNYYKDTYDKDNHRISHGNKDRSKDRYQNKDQYRDDSYDKIRSRSKEKDYLYNDDDIFDSEIKRVHKILQMISQEREMAIGFRLAFSENPDKILDSIKLILLFTSRCRSFDSRKK